MLDALERRPARGPRDVSRHAFRLAEEFTKLHARHSSGVAYIATYRAVEPPRIEMRRKALRVSDLEAKLGVRASGTGQGIALLPSPRRRGRCSRGWRSRSTR